MESSMKENSNIMYKKVWIRKQKQDQVNEFFLAVMLSVFVKSQGHDESIMEGVEEQYDIVAKLVHTLL